MQNNVPDTSKGVKVSDDMLGDPDILPTKVKFHGDVALAEEQKKVVDVLPKNTIYQQ